MKLRITLFIFFALVCMESRAGDWGNSFMQGFAQAAAEKNARKQAQEDALKLREQELQLQTQSQKEMMYIQYQHAKEIRNQKLQHFQTNFPIYIQCIEDSMPKYKKLNLSVTTLHSALNGDCASQKISVDMSINEFPDIQKTVDDVVINKIVNYQGSASIQKVNVTPTLQKAENLSHSEQYIPSQIIPMPGLECDKNIYPLLCQ